MENQRLHFRHVMLHYFKKGISDKDIATEICIVYGSCATSVQTVRSWFRIFRTGNFHLKDEEHSGRTSTAVTEIIKAG